jgi:hypothetical protein
VLNNILFFSQLRNSSCFDILIAERLLKLRMTNTNNLDLINKTSIALLLMLVVKVLQNNDIPGTMTTNHSEQELFLN